MRKLPFKKSSLASIGVELELQIIDPMTNDLIARAKDLMRNIREKSYQKRIKPEITQSMIEINSSIHTSSDQLEEELLDMRDFLLEQGKMLGICFAGGGTHPFQKWSSRKIFPTKRFKNLSRHYRYLSKCSTVFGQHIHVGCTSGEDALYLTHALTRYVPQLIAMSASSPFFQGIDTGYNSSRSNVFSAFPLSGVIPYLTTWDEFSTYFYKMRKLGIVETMKDFYWDIRPKPEFGTVEIRVCDTPLTIRKAVVMAAYIQALALYLLEEKPKLLSHDLYYLYNYNRFQAIRYGFDGEFINPVTSQRTTIGADIAETMTIIEKQINVLNNGSVLSQLKMDVTNKQNDTVLLRELYKEVKSLPKLVHEQCLLWATG